MAALRAVLIVAMLMFATWAWATALGQRQLNIDQDGMHTARTFSQGERGSVTIGRDFPSGRVTYIALRSPSCETQLRCERFSASISDELFGVGYDSGGAECSAETARIGRQWVNEFAQDVIQTQQFDPELAQLFATLRGSRVTECMPVEGYGCRCGGLVRR